MRSAFSPKQDLDPSAITSETGNHFKGQVQKTENPISGGRCQEETWTPPRSQRNGTNVSSSLRLLAFQETHVSPEQTQETGGTQAGEAASPNNGGSQRPGLWKDIRLLPNRHMRAQRWGASPSAPVHLHLLISSSPYWHWTVTPAHAGPQRVGVVGV